MIEIEYFNLESLKATGGVTGSGRVSDWTGNYYQLKPSILDNKLIRRLKANNTDRENFGEVIASFVGRAFLGEQAVPTVSLVYDKQKRRALIASEYIKGDSVATLDEHARQLGILDEKKKHIMCTLSDKDNPTQGSMGLNAPNRSVIKETLMRAIGLSALVGDHDINPGNMLVVQRGDLTTVARIDFGHAFNDLLNASAFHGGQLQDPENPILDFFNRDKVAGLGGAPSKLWRDYPGIIPSQEMVNVLRELESDYCNRVSEGIEEARNEFLKLVAAMRANNDVNGLEHVQRSLAAIASNISDQPLTFWKQLPEETVGAVFDEYERFLIKNGDNLTPVANIMELQLEIDKALLKGDPLSPYAHALLDEGDFPMREGEIQWLRTEKMKPFSGSFDSYLARRVEILSAQAGANNEEIIRNFRALREHQDKTDKTTEYRKSLQIILHRPKAMSEPEPGSDLLEQLHNYIDERLHAPDRKMGRYSRIEKVTAAQALASILRGEKIELSERAKGALTNGKLGRIVTGAVPLIKGSPAQKLQGLLKQIKEAQQEVDNKSTMNSP